MSFFFAYLFSDDLLRIVLAKIKLKLCIVYAHVVVLLRLEIDNKLNKKDVTTVQNDK